MSAPHRRNLPETRVLTIRSKSRWAKQRSKFRCRPVWSMSPPP